MSRDPFEQFDQWFKLSERCSRLAFPNAMCLATVDSEGNPQARMVLLKDHGPEGFTFYTNSRSEKGRALEENPKASLLFHWEPLHRQVRIVGSVEQVSSQEADQYFATRPRGSQIGAWASNQSEEIANRNVLEDRVLEYEQKFSDGNVPRPPHWTGYRVIPYYFEFWELRLSRLHDRIAYRFQDESWNRVRLSP